MVIAASLDAREAPAPYEIRLVQCHPLAGVVLDDGGACGGSWCSGPPQEAAFDGPLIHVDDGQLESPATLLEKGLPDDRRVKVASDGQEHGALHGS